MKRITITIDEAVYDKLPKYGKSGVINLLVKQHFQKEGADQLYQTIKQKLQNDWEFQEWVKDQAGAIVDAYKEDRGY